MASDRGPVFDGVRIGRPATGALVDAGYRTMSDLPDELDELLDLHGVGPSALQRLRAAFIRTDDAVLCVDTVGERDDPPVLLIGGACQSMDWWESDFCQRLADGGRHVIRFDARDTGRSSVSPVGEPSYTSDQLTTDPLHVLDALGIERAHLVGISMGGGIGQQLAAEFADRVATLTLIATSAAGTRAGAETLPPPARRSPRPCRIRRRCRTPKTATPGSTIWWLTNACSPVRSCSPSVRCVGSRRSWSNAATIS